MYLLPQELIDKVQEYCDFSTQVAMWKARLVCKITASPMKSFSVRLRDDGGGVLKVFFSAHGTKQLVLSKFIYPREIVYHDGYHAHGIFIHGVVTKLDQPTSTSTNIPQNPYWFEQECDLHERIRRLHNTVRSLNSVIALGRRT